MQTQVNVGAEITAFPNPTQNSESEFSIVNTSSDIKFGIVVVRSNTSSIKNIPSEQSNPDKLPADAVETLNET